MKIVATASTLIRLDSLTAGSVFTTLKGQHWVKGPSRWVEGEKAYRIESTALVDGIQQSIAGDTLVEAHKNAVLHLNPS